MPDLLPPVLTSTMWPIHISCFVPWPRWQVQEST